MVWDAEVSRAVAHWAPFYRVPAMTSALIHGVIEQESGHGSAPSYIAHSGVVPEPDGDHSYGPMQIKGDTVRSVLRLGFPPEDLASHPELGIWYGVKEFARRMSLLGGDPTRAISAWNAGLGGVGRNPLYVQSVLALWKRYRGAVVSVGPALALAAGIAWMLWGRARRRTAI